MSLLGRAPSVDLIQLSLATVPGHVDKAATSVVVVEISGEMSLGISKLQQVENAVIVKSKVLVTMHQLNRVEGR